MKVIRVDEIMVNDLLGFCHHTKTAVTFLRVHKVTPFKMRDSNSVNMINCIDIRMNDWFGIEISEVMRSDLLVMVERD